MGMLITEIWEDKTSRLKHTRKMVDLVNHKGQKQT